MGKFDGIPLTPNVAREIIELVMQERDKWKRGDLADRVHSFHKDQGGVSGQQDILAVVKKALNVLQADGKVENSYYGHWRWIPNGEAVNGATIHEDINSDDLDSEDLEEDNDTVIVKEIGVGRESIYLYYNPNDEKLAKLEGRNTWECKIGRTGAADSFSRILGQGVRTALSHQPIVGLVIKTDNSAALEKALHASLRLIDSDVPDSPGVEWFMTSPELVELWYQTFQQSLLALKSRQGQ